MTEQELLSRFCKFLVDQKKYPPSSLLTRTPAFAVGTGRVQGDLLLLDVNIGDYIGLVEFKSRIDPQIKKSALRQIQQYLGIIRAPSLPSYLVYPISEDDFNILVFGESDWEPMPKDEFPQFETLATKKKREEKLLENEIHDTVVVNEERRKKRALSSSIWTLISIGIGGLAALLSNYISKDLRIDDQADFKPEIRLFETLNTRIDKLQELIGENRVLYDTTFVVDSTKTLRVLDERVTSLERSFIQEPGRILALKDLAADLAVLREELRGQEKQLLLRHENLISKVEGLNSMVNGILFTLLTAALGVFGYGLVFLLRNHSGKPGRF